MGDLEDMLVEIEIPASKIFDYALNKDHPFGKDKAFVFESVLGFSASNGHVLIEKIREGAWQNRENLVEKELTPQGRRLYKLILEIEGENGRKAKVLTVWQKIDRTTLRLVTLYVCKSKRT